MSLTTGLVVVQSNSLTPLDCNMPILHCLLEFAQIMSIELMMPSNHLILCFPLLLLPSIFPSIRIFFSG